MENRLGEINYRKLALSSQRTKETNGLTSKQIIIKQVHEIVKEWSGNLHLTPLFIRLGVDRYIQNKTVL